MQAKDVFGIVLRIIGVICLMQSVLDASVAISMATAVPAVDALAVSMPTSRAIAFLAIGLLLLFGTKVIVRLAYEKDR